jgi:Ala-tRNA(Pro) deacylase
MLNKTLRDYLEKHHVQYKEISHAPSFTAQEIAAAAHISGKQLAKTVIVKIGEQLAMVVVRADSHVNFAALQKLTGETNIDLAREADFKNKFPECEVGAMPPFGNLYGLPVFISSDLAKDKITFNGGSHSDLIQMTYQDFIDLVKPELITTH